MADRDNFSSSVKRTLANRAAHMCSHCKDITSAASSDSNRAVNLGKASHICAAAGKGPRYDPNQTEQERKSIENAIWLCGKCATTVDDDSSPYPKDELLKWKAAHEEWVRNGGVVPALPYIEVATAPGITIPVGTVFQGSGDRFREHTLSVRNNNDVILHEFKCRIAFPEPILKEISREISPGIGVDFVVDRMKLIVKAAAINSSGERPPIGRWRFDVERVPARSSMKVSFWTAAHADIGTTLARARDGELQFHLLGSYQFEHRGIMRTHEYLVPLNWEERTRKITSLPCCSEMTAWELNLDEVW